MGAEIIVDKRFLVRVDDALEYLLHFTNREGSRAEQFCLEAIDDLREEVAEMTNWRGFWLDTNKYDGMVSTPQQWGKVKKIYPVESLAKARLKPEVGSTPIFGFRPEMQGETLETFFKKNDMKL